MDQKLPGVPFVMQCGVPRMTCEGRNNCCSCVAFEPLAPGWGAHFGLGHNPNHRVNVHRLYGAMIGEALRSSWQKKEHTGKCQVVNL